MAERDNLPRTRDEDYASIFGDSEAGRVSTRAGTRMYENALRRIALERAGVDEQTGDLFQRAQQAMVKQQELATQPFGVGGRPQQFQQGRTAAEVQMLGQIQQSRAQQMRELSQQELLAEQQGLEFGGQAFQQFAQSEQYQLAMESAINDIIENPNLSDEQKIRRLVSQFSITEQQAKQLVDANVQQRGLFARALGLGQGPGTVAGRSTLLAGAGIVGGVGGSMAVGAIGGAKTGALAGAVGAKGAGAALGTIAKAAAIGGAKGAIKGSVVPGKGTAIGFVIGFLIAGGIAIAAMGADTDKVYNELRGN